MQHAAPHQSGFIVPPPFNEASRGSHDCILMSSEGHQFGIVRYILSLASPIFADMFAIPQGPANEMSENLPVVNMEEDTKTLYAFLLLVYPPGSGQVPAPDVDLIYKLMAAHEKYEMPLTRVSELARVFYAPHKPYTKGTELSVSNALELYGLAWRLDLAEEAKIASEHTHNANLVDKATAEKVVRWSGGSLEPLLALIQLRARREIELEKIIGAIDMRSYLCVKHGFAEGGASSRVEYHRRVQLEKEKIRRQLETTYYDARSVLYEFQDPSDPSQWDEEEYSQPPCPNCRHPNGGYEETSARVEAVLANYPQRITSFKGQPAETVETAVTGSFYR